MVVLELYTDPQGRIPFERWFDGIDDHAALRVTAALDKLRQGNLPAKTVGGGVMELRLDFGPGYRIYFGRDGDALVILLGGGTKKQQQRDIAIAQQCWRNYKSTRRGK